MHKKTLKDNGVKLLSAMEQIPDTPEGNLMEALLEGFNQYFSEELAQKVSRGIRESWIKGNSTGQPLYGYDIVNKKYVINEHEAVFVKDIFTMYAQGYTAPAILEDISARGATKRSGKPMDVTYIYNILHNVRYTGRVQHDVWYDNIFPALVSQDIWDKIAVIKDENKLAPSRKKDGYGYILSGKLICGKCKRRMMGMSGTSQSGAAYYYYICREKRRKKGNCTGIVPKQQIEDLVMETTIDLLSSEENIKAVAEGVASTHNERAETHSALKYLTKKRDAAIKASNNLIKAIEQGVFNEMTTARLNELETEITQLEFEINREQQKAAVVLSESDIKKYLLSMFRENTEDLAVRKLIVNTFIREIILYEDSLVITYNFTEKHDPFTVDSEHIKELEKQIKTASKTALPSVQSSRITKSFVPHRNNTNPKQNSRFVLFFAKDFFGVVSIVFVQAIIQIIQMGMIRSSRSNAENSCAKQSTAPVPLSSGDLLTTANVFVMRLSGAAVFLISNGYNLPFSSKTTSISFASRSR